MQATRTSPLAERPPVRREVWMGVALCIVGVLAYINILPNEFVFDDEPNIELRQDIRDLSRWENWRSMLSQSRPLVTLSLAVNYAIDAAVRAPMADDLYPPGLDPRGYHVLNIVIHLAAGLTLFGLVRRTLLLPRFGGRFASNADWLALAVALLWLVHPLNTQAVTYTIQRGESMMGLFFLLTLYCSLRQWLATGGARTGWLAAAVLACAAGMASKEVMVAAPLVVFLYDWTFLRQASHGWLRRRAGLYGALAATWVLLFAIVGAGITGEHASAGFTMPVMSWWRYATSQFLVIFHYLRLSVVPHPLVIDYMWLPALLVDMPADRQADRLVTHVILPAIPVVGLLAASVVGVVRRRWWGFLGAAFFLILAPTSSIMPIADLAMEHRMYLPLICVLGVAVFGVYALLGKVDERFAAVAGCAALVVLAGAFAVLTVVRNTEYRTRIDLWETVTQRAPGNARGWHNLGSAYDRLADATDDAPQRNVLKEAALFCFEQTLELLPTYHAAAYGIGKIRLERGDADRAAELFRLAIAIEPGDTDYHLGLGAALWQKGDLDGAEASFREAIRLKPDSAKGYNSLGGIYGRRGQHESAVDAFRQALALDPQLLEAYANLAVALASTGRAAEAAATLDRAVEVAHQQGRDPAFIASLRARADQYRRSAAPPAP